MTEQTTMGERRPAEKPRKRGARKAGAASTVTLTGATADMLDRLVEHYRDASGWDVDRRMVVDKLIRQACESDALADALVRG